MVARLTPRNHSARIALTTATALPLRARRVDRGQIPSPAIVAKGRKRPIGAACRAQPAAHTKNGRRRDGACRHAHDRCGRALGAAPSRALFLHLVLGSAHAGAGGAGHSRRRSARPSWPWCRRPWSGICSSSSSRDLSGNTCRSCPPPKRPESRARRPTGPQQASTSYASCSPWVPLVPPGATPTSKRYGSSGLVNVLYPAAVRR